MSESNTSKPSSDTPFNIAVLGNFSGRSSQAVKDLKPIKNRRFIEIDRDNFDSVMAGFDINLKLNFTDKDSAQINVKNLDDFHPDTLVEKLASFSQLRSLRSRLQDNQTFAAAAAELQNWKVPESIKPTKPTVNATQTTAVTIDTNVALNQSDVSNENLLDNILETENQQTTDQPASEASQIDRFIKSIVAPYIQPAADPRQDDMVAMVDNATELYLREILHDDDFQGLESLWRSLWFLVKRLETDSTLKIFILDVSHLEWEQDLAVEDLTTSGLYRKFCDTAEGDRLWSVILGNYTLSDNIEDIISLGSMGEIAQQAGAPFLAAAYESFVGCDSFYETPDYDDWKVIISDGVMKAWQLLRQSPVSAYIGLALPRFLLRVPYGKKSDPIDSLEFEEMIDDPCHESYLWGNPAFIKVECMARNFKQHGWNMNIEQVNQTDNLPLHYFSQDGETISKPIAEIYLTEKGGEIIKKQGIIPLWSVKNMDSIRSSDYLSVDDNKQNIVGRWS